MVPEPNHVVLNHLYTLSIKVRFTAVVLHCIGSCVLFSRDAIQSAVLPWQVVCPSVCDVDLS